MDVRPGESAVDGGGQQARIFPKQAVGEGEGLGHRSGGGGPAVVGAVEHLAAGDHGSGPDLAVHGALDQLGHLGRDLVLIDVRVRAVGDQDVRERGHAAGDVRVEVETDPDRNLVPDPVADLLQEKAFSVLLVLEHHCAVQREQDRVVRRIGVDGGQDVAGERIEGRAGHLAARGGTRRDRILEAPVMALGGIEERRHLDPGPADIGGDLLAAMAIPRFEGGEVRRHVAECVGLVLDAGDEHPSCHGSLPSIHRTPSRGRPERWDGNAETALSSRRGSRSERRTGGTPSTRPDAPSTPPSTFCGRPGRAARRPRDAHRRAFRASMPTIEPMNGRSGGACRVLQPPGAGVGGNRDRRGADAASRPRRSADRGSRLGHQPARRQEALGVDRARGRVSGDPPLRRGRRHRRRRRRRARGAAWRARVDDAGRSSREGRDRRAIRCRPGRARTSASGDDGLRGRERAWRCPR